MRCAGGYQGDKHWLPYPASPLAGSTAHRRPNAPGGALLEDGGRSGHGENSAGVPEDTLRQHQGGACSEGES